jgi:hypothetical protein
MGRVSGECSGMGRKGRETHSPTGTEKSHFFDGVFWAPPSICSQSVRSSYAPPCNSLPNGMPVTQWNMRYEN